MVDIGAVEQMSLVEVMGALTERGVDFTGCFDKTLLLQKLVEVMQAEAPHAAAAPPPVVASQEDVLDALLDGAAGSNPSHWGRWAGSRGWLSRMWRGVVMENSQVIDTGSAAGCGTWRGSVQGCLQEVLIGTEHGFVIVLEAAAIEQIDDAIGVHLPLLHFIPQA